MLSVVKFLVKAKAYPAECLDLVNEIQEKSRNENNNVARDAVWTENWLNTIRSGIVNDDDLKIDNVLDFLTELGSTLGRLSPILSFQSVFICFVIGQVRHGQRRMREDQEWLTRSQYDGTTARALVDYELDKGYFKPNKKGQLTPSRDCTVVYLVKISEGLPFTGHLFHALSGEVRAGRQDAGRTVCHIYREHLAYQHSWVIQNTVAALLRAFTPGTAQIVKALTGEKSLSPPEVLHCARLTTEAGLDILRMADVANNIFTSRHLTHVYSGGVPLRVVLPPQQQHDTP